MKDFHRSSFHRLARLTLLLATLGAVSGCAAEESGEAFETHVVTEDGEAVHRYCRAGRCYEHVWLMLWQPGEFSTKRICPRDPDVAHVGPGGWTDESPCEFFNERWDNGDEDVSEARNTYYGYWPNGSAGGQNYAEWRCGGVEQPTRSDGPHDVINPGGRWAGVIDGSQCPRGQTLEKLVLYRNFAP